MGVRPVGYMEMATRVTVGWFAGRTVKNNWYKKGDVHPITGNEGP